MGVTGTFKVLAGTLQGIEGLPERVSPKGGARWRAVSI
jgi:hypothetical protein